MRELVGFVLVCALSGGSIWGRWRLGRPLDYPFFLKLVPVATAASFAMVGVLYPFGYARISRAMHGGTLATNLPPGTGEDALFGLFTLGAISMVVAVVAGFWALLKS